MQISPLQPTNLYIAMFAPVLFVLCVEELSNHLATLGLVEHRVGLWSIFEPGVLSDLCDVKSIILVRVITSKTNHS